MKRLVEKTNLPILGETYITNTDDTDLKEMQILQAVLKKLYEYEDAEEQGLLIRLPCGIEDTVYVIAECGHVNKKLDGTQGIIVHMKIAVHTIVTTLLAARIMWKKKQFLKILC